MKKVNITSISNKIKFIYGDECEKNTVGMVIFSDGTDYYFDSEYKNKMTNEEVEALLLRGAVVSKDGKYYRPNSFNGENVSLSGAVVDPDDIEVDLSEYATKKYVKETIFNTRLGDDIGVKYIAHRGYSSIAPENTIPAYIEAGKAGFWGAETDIQETSDGEFVLMHDTTVDRTTNGTGEVSSMTLTQVKKLVVDYGSGIGLYPDLRVPTMKEFLGCCKEYGMVPIIEIKTINNIDGFLQIIEEFGMIEQCIVISFNNNILQALRTACDDIRIQTLSFVSYDHLTEWNFDLDAQATVNNTADVIDKIKNIHKLGRKINVWTVNDEMLAKELISEGIDYVTTDALYSKDMEHYSIIKTHGQEISILQNKLDRILKMLADNPTNNIYKVTGFKPVTLSNGEYIDTPLGETNRVVSTCDLTPAVSTKFKLNYNNTNHNLAIHVYNQNNKLSFDSGYLSPGQEVICLSSLNASNIFVYGQIRSENISQSNLDELNNMNITLEYIQSDISSIVDTQYYTDEYSLSTDDFVYAGSNNDREFPQFFGQNQSGNRIGCITKVFAPNKVKVTFDSNYNLTLVPFNKNGIRIKDIGWCTSGDTYDMTDGSISGCVCFSLYCGTKEGTFTDDTLKAFIESIVIEVVE